MDTTAKEKFVAVNDAYGVLGDDRKRREYDRVQLTEYATYEDITGRPLNTAWYDYERDRQRRASRATYAWMNARHPYPGGRPNRFTHPPPKHPEWTSPRRTGRKEKERQEEESEEDVARKESSAVRFAQVAGLLFFIWVLTGGLSS